MLKRVEGFVESTDKESLIKKIRLEKRLERWF